MVINNVHDVIINIFRIFYIVVKYIYFFIDKCCECIVLYFFRNKKHSFNYVS